MKNMIYLFPDGHLEAWRVFWQDGQQKEFGCINVSFVPQTSANPRQVNIIEFLYSIFIFLYICLCLLWVRSCLIISHICPWDPNQQNEWSKTHQIKGEWRRKGLIFSETFLLRRICQKSPKNPHTVIHGKMKWSTTTKHMSQKSWTKRQPFPLFQKELLPLYLKEANLSISFRNGWQTFLPHIFCTPKVTNWGGEAILYLLFQ